MPQLCLLSGKCKAFTGSNYIFIQALLKLLVHVNNTPYFRHGTFQYQKPWHFSTRQAESRASPGNTASFGKSGWMLPLAYETRIFIKVFGGRECQKLEKCVWAEVSS